MPSDRKTEYASLMKAARAPKTDQNLVESTPAKPSNKTEGVKTKVVKSTSDDYTQVSLYIPRQMHRKLKSASAMTDQDMSDIAIAAFQAWLTENSESL